ncbi:MAG: HAMP domain-containing histidine kinase [Gemmatimonadetes bacterium]|nr:HAMP domain-containing histidine kinase [Gemmatimonadota bacterium]
MVDFRTSPFVTADEGAPDLGDPERVLRGLPPDVRPIASYLWARTDRQLPREGEFRPPSVGSLDQLVAGAGAVRDAITDAGARGLGLEKVRALHGRLDRAVAKLVGELLERTKARSERRLRDIAHDLRSPLNSILVLVDALANAHSGALNEVQRRQVGVLYTSALSLVDWLNDLIDSSAIRDGASVRPLEERFSMESLLNQVDQLLGPLAAHSGVELAFGLETLGPRLGDRRILARVLLNLVSNAIDATPRGGRVLVRARELRAGWLHLTVEDGGTEGDADRIRAHLTAPPEPRPLSGEGGQTRGLGLSICGRLLTAVGGRIDIEGGDGEGCRFLFEVPFDRA